MKQLLFLFLVFWGSKAYSQTEIFVNGNKLEMSPALQTEIFDPITGTEEERTVQPSPVKVNGEKIFRVQDLDEIPAFSDAFGKRSKLSIFLFDSIKSLLNTLPDGEYTLKISNFVVDKSGYAIYFEFSGIEKLTSYMVPKTTVVGHERTDTFVRIVKGRSDKGIPSKIKEAVNQKNRELLTHMPRVSPGKINGLAVNSRDELFNENAPVIVKNHLAIFGK